MGSVNKAILVGNLGNAAELRYTKSGTAVCTVRMATTERYNDKEGNKKEATEWHSVVIWGKTAEALQQYLTKGKQIYVEGRLQTRKWTDKDGKDRYSTEVRADRVVLLSSAGGGDGQRRPRGQHVSDEEIAAGGGTEPDPAYAEAPGVDDIPF
jgi:single-strand DNA-binding protein